VYVHKSTAVLVETPLREPLIVCHVLFRKARSCKRVLTVRHQRGEEKRAADWAFERRHGHALSKPIHAARDSVVREQLGETQTIFALTRILRTGQLPGSPQQAFWISISRQ
jgi:hypothetical protein